MSSLAKFSSSKLVGFFSYSREDDKGLNDVLSKLRVAIQAELGAQLGRNQNNFRIWQDTSAIPHGALWEKKVREGIAESVFFIPIVTPRAVNSPHCATEFDMFLAREAVLGREDLVFPILYISIPELEDEALCREDPVLRIVKARQYLDWRAYRYRGLGTPEVQENIIQFCANIANALRKPWESPDERQQRQEAEVRQRAEEEQRRIAAQIEAKQLAEEEDKRREIESARLAEEEEQRQRAKIKVARATKAERQRREAEAARVTEEEERRKSAQIEAARSAEEERQRREAEAARVTEEEERRKTAQIEAARSAEEKRQRREAEAARVTEEEERRKTAQIEAARSAEEERQRRETEAARRADEEQRNKIAEAQPIEGAAQTDKQSAANESSPTAVEREAVVSSMMPVRPPGFAQFPDLKPRRAAMIAGAALAAALLIGVLVWPQAKPSLPSQQVSISPAPVSTPIKPPPSKQETTAIPAPPPEPAKPAPSAQPASMLTALSPQPAKPPVAPPAIASSHPPPAEALKPDAPPLPSTIEAARTNLACQPSQASAEQKSHGTGGPLSPPDLVTLKLAMKPQEVRSIAISPDGRRMITAGDDAVIRIWDATNIKWIRDIRGQHTAAVYSVAYSADGSLFASASWDGTVRIWDARSFALLQTFNTDNGNGLVKQNAVAFAPSSTPRYVDSAGEDGNVWIWDLQNPSHFFKWPDPDRPPSPVRSLSFAPDNSGAMVTAAYDGNIRFFTASRKISAQSATTSHQDKLLHVAYSPDGSLVASAGVDTKYQILKIWNVANQTFKAYQGYHNYAASLAWSPNGKVVAVGEGGRNPSAEIVDLQSGVKLKVFSGHAADVEAIAFHPNKKWLVSGSEDGTTKIWDQASGAELLTLVGFDNGHLAYAPTGCYTGSANAASYVRYVTKDDQGREHDAGSVTNLFVPGDSAAALLPR